MGYREEQLGEARSIIRKEFAPFRDRHDHCRRPAVLGHNRRLALLRRLDDGRERRLGLFQVKGFQVGLQCSSIIARFSRLRASWYLRHDRRFTSATRMEQAIVEIANAVFVGPDGVLLPRRSPQRKDYPDCRSFLVATPKKARTRTTLWCAKVSTPAGSRSRPALRRRAGCTAWPCRNYSPAEMLVQERRGEGRNGN